MTNVVLVVDMVKGFLEPGHNLYCGDEARQIIPKVKAMLQRERGFGSQVLFVSDHHDPDDLEFQIFPVHCVKGTEEPNVIDELAEFVTQDNVVAKNRYSGFFNTDLAERLTSLNPDKVLICGRLHRHLCAPHHLRCPQPGLPRGGAHGLRCQLRPGRPCVGFGAPSKDTGGQGYLNAVGPIYRSAVDFASVLAELAVGAVVGLAPSAIALQTAVRAC